VRTGPLIAGLGLLAAAATGGLVVVLLTQPFAPTQLEAVGAATSAPVVTQSFHDERAVSVRAEVGEPVSVTLPGSGRVTSVACTRGDQLTSGSAPLALEGKPVLALHLASPPWRDLAVGAKGRDVDALRAELERLGYDVASADGGTPLGQDVLAAFRALAQSVDLDVPQAGPVPLNSVVWLPTPELTVDECLVRLGEQVAPGAEFVRSARPLVSASVAPWPGTLAAGERVVVVDGVELPVDDAGTILDLEGLSVTSAFRGATVEGGSVSEGAIVGSLRLVEPVDVAVVPPGAVTTTDGVTGCVATSAGELRQVRVVGSQLGQTFVVFDTTPDEIALTGPESCP